MLLACRREDPEAGLDAGRGDHRSLAVPEQGVLHRALLPASQEVLHQALHPELWEASLLESQASLQQVVSQALAQRHSVQPDARRQDVAASRHARRGQPEEPPADAVARALSMAHRLAVSRSMARAQRLALAEEAVPGVQPEELSAQVSARVQPLALRLAEAEVVP